LRLHVRWPTLSWMSENDIPKLFINAEPGAIRGNIKYQ
jgi:hypothetical protein